MYHKSINVELQPDHDGRTNRSGFAWSQIIDGPNAVTDLVLKNKKSHMRGEFFLPVSRITVYFVFFYSFSYPSAALRLN